MLADADIDADGDPRAYHPNSKSGKDALANAGSPGRWWGIATDRNGVPFIQTKDDPAPGFYVSTTTYQRPKFPKNDPRRYVDSAEVPFIVVEDFIRKRAKGIVLGCKAKVTNIKNGKSTPAVVIDMGPLYKIGELSQKAAHLLGIASNPRRGGTSENIVRYEFWPDTPGEWDGEVFSLIPRAGS